MEYTEQLDWILDKTGPKNSVWDEAAARENIAFVQALGLRCDSVGWCRMDLADPRTPEIFGKISEFCRDGSWTARCIYTRQYTNVQSQWYELVPSALRSDAVAGFWDIPTEEGTPLRVCKIHAFRAPGMGPKHLAGKVLVPEPFRDFCTAQGFDLDFCWVRDVGKYAASQYFFAYGTRPLPRMAVDFGLRDSPARILEAGGWLPEIRKIFHSLQFIDLPDCYLAADLPASGIVYGYIPRTHSCAGRYRLLIHRDTASILLAEKVLSPAALRPAPVVDALPGGYCLQAVQPVPRPARAVADKLLFEWQALKAKDRPLRITTEKEALKLLRSAKKARAEDFQKALPKAAGQALLDGPYSSIVPCYLVANGGYLSEEYNLLPHARSVAETAGFQALQKAEALQEAAPEGIVIAKCPDGDAVLLHPDGSVCRFSHEAPIVTAQWPSLAQFIAEALTE